MNLNDFIMTNEMPIRLGFFFGVFGVMALWEMVSPRRRLQTSKAVRWANNLGLVFFNSFVLRLVFPAAAVGMAVFASEQGWGLFNYIAAPFWVAGLATALFLPGSVLTLAGGALFGPVLGTFCNLRFPPCGTVAETC